MTKSSIKIAVVKGDALEFRADVLALKYAQSLHGVDRVAHQALGRAGVKLKLPKPGTQRIIASGGAVAADRILFVGVQPLQDLGYAGIRTFARRALSSLADQKGKLRRVALTIHGPGFGLDETEAFESELAGVLDAIGKNEYPDSLELVSFVEMDKKRVRRLAEVLRRLVPTGSVSRGGRGTLSGLDRPAKKTLRTAGSGSASKPRVFVAMPFADEMGDTFHYGIQGAVNAAGLLAERADLATFAGDVMDWVKTRISSAKLVIADLTTANANVYLEVGYAWGKGVPTILLAKSTADLKFDVKGQRCIIYSSISDLEAKLARELKGLLG